MKKNKKKKNSIARRVLYQRALRRREKSYKMESGKKGLAHWAEPRDNGR